MEPIEVKGVLLSEFLKKQALETALKWFGGTERKLFQKWAIQTPRYRHNPHRGQWRQRHTEPDEAVRAERLARHPRKAAKIAASARTSHTRRQRRTDATSRVIQGDLICLNCRDTGNCKTHLRRNYIA